MNSLKIQLLNELKEDRDFLIELQKILYIDDLEDRIEDLESKIN